MVRGYTTIGQSKKLLSLGLDPSTADMHLINGKHAGCVPYVEIIKNNNPMLKAVMIQPCWSLTALLKLLPDIIKVEEECYTFSLIKNVIEYVGHDGNILYSTGGKSFVDAAVKMFELIDK